MPGYRLYKSAVAGATGRIGKALTRQLLLSPLCEEAHIVARRKVGFPELAASAKLRHHVADFGADVCGLQASALKGVDAAFCLLGARSGWSNETDVVAVERDAVLRFARLCEAAGIPHLSLLSSAWADPSRALPFARVQGETVEAVAAMSFARISVFRPSAALGPDGRLEPGSGFLANALWQSVPVAAQFLPNRYRPMALDDIVLAMRLNVELCDASERVEMMDYRDMMMVIGKAADI
ncbi:unnamed protein product [Effrenium voratum]|uniref:NAD(P)-binding domain-containing protein n=1 Tax=Effrenium voratum TaxID=2562239 RepID=A0AA36IDC7_9DINO|nr:unnamed protein product [Effrenium voratum]